MSYARPIHTRLLAHAPLVALLTGGLMLYQDMPPLGISRAGLASAYHTTTGKLKPLGVVKGRAVIPTNSLQDGTYTTVRQVVEIQLYNDASAGYATLESAAEMIYALLQSQPVAGSFDLTLSNEINDERAPDVGNACFIRRDYQVIGRKI